MGLALFEKHSAIACQLSVDCRQPLPRVPVSAPCLKNLVQPVNQAIRPLLMLQTVHRKCLSAMPVRAHHALDEHLRKIVEHACVLQLDECCGQRVPFRRRHLQHSSRVEALRLQSELPQLQLRKKGFVAKFRHGRRASRTLRYPETSCRLEFESVTDNCNSLRERTGTEAESAFNDARLATYILREVEDRRPAFA